MIRHIFASVAALAAVPAIAAELHVSEPAGVSRNGALAGAYVRIPLGASATADRAPRAGLRLALARTVHEPHSFSANREANLLDVRLTAAKPVAFYVAGRSIEHSDRLNAESGSGGRLDKIMIGAGIALGAVAAFFLVSSVAN